MLRFLRSSDHLNSHSKAQGMYDAVHKKGAVSWCHCQNNDRKAVRLLENELQSRIGVIEGSEILPA